MTGHPARRLLLGVLFFAGALILGEALLFSGDLADWRLYVFAAVGGVGFVLVTDWSGVRRLLRGLRRPA